MNYKTKIFIEKAIKKHNNKYNYDKVEYINTRTNIIIICKIHNEFLQNPYSHLNGHGCIKCSCVGAPKLTTTIFIENAIKKHNNKYNYDKVEYINSKTNVIIICKIHGEFLQPPGRHCNGAGCLKCANINISKRLSSNTEEFIIKASNIHNNKYNYDKVEYINARTNIIIICKIHGKFLQTPSNHLKGHGCLKCANINTSKRMLSTTKEFIKKASAIHKYKFEYTKVKYINNSTNITIICKLHGDFLQKPHNHLAGDGCIKCSYNRFSKPQIQWLDLLSKLNDIQIQHAMNDGEFKIPTTKYYADGYCKETNTIFEYHGDYWHGNPKKFDQDSINKTCNITHGELHEKTLKKEQIIKDLGYNLITMWESDWKNINKSIKILQKKYKMKNIK